MTTELITPEQQQMLLSELDERIAQWPCDGLAGALSVISAVERMRDRFGVRYLTELSVERFDEAVKYLREEFRY